MQERAAFIAGIQSRFAAVMDPVIQEGETYAIVDFPNHPNVGDSAIWTGMKAYLKRRNVHTSYQCDIHTYDKKKLAASIAGGASIIFHGGGNFGDIWEDHQRLRERVLQDFPATPVIQFPQSVHFDKTESADRMRTILRTRSSFTMFARDEESVRICREQLGIDAALCCDSAFWLGEIPRPVIPTCDILWLGRTDKEAKNRPEQANDIVVKDWLVSFPDPRFLLCYASSKIAGAIRSAGFAAAPLFDDITNNLFDGVAPLHVQRGLELLSQGRVVITDRLHGHILCLLLGIQHVMLDNSYGKLRHFHETWTKECAGVTMAASPEEAVSIARAMLGEAP